MDLIAVYKELYRTHGPQGWWPVLGEDDEKIRAVYGIPYQSFEKYRLPWRDPFFEIAVGAILTQNTAWTSVVLALTNLFQAHALTPELILSSDLSRLESLIRPAGYFRQKARALQTFSNWVVTNYHGDIRRARRRGLPTLRTSLLDLWGVGFETADDILLYALNKPIFVIDAYTKRLCEFHGISFKSYEEYRLFFEQQLTNDQNTFHKTRVKWYQEYHALIVRWGKT
ncbi:MAG: hypothetical protein A3J66_00685 [Candidatus Magasanikbacteria bacterium RIFCSPHIGHO2_02_FULL_47_14]|uniref:HhH-GPD domain-containing protein n=1 Tax=Candidatus Magasanikbacteria bacterium RIFCSPHIGHO2_02_FULL_47_14 TaxID=1798680 RepID=A0A1F6LYZ8_9BACT|nr:MAG: hypothetical protein A3J66_00685 [Candidatus Magasanikbacteria bacterium RIFCSPHIGHO2_02_FULL_47_14]